MNWKRLLIALVTKSNYKKFISNTKNPQQAKTYLWQNEILPLMRQSSYWHPKLLEKKSLSLDEFSITTYEDYELGLSVAQQGKTQPFNGEKLIFWSETSGTAGARKFFPITSSFQRQFQRTIPPFIYNLTQQIAGFFQEKVLYLVAVDSNTMTPGGIPSGWISNFNYQNLPAFLKRFYAIPGEVFANSGVYVEWAPLYALASDLSAIFAVTPMVIEQFYERCSTRFSYYLDYLSGEKKIPSYLPPLHISKKRLRYLKGLGHRTNPSFKTLWPSLSLVGCWMSGLCALPAQQLRTRIGSEIRMVDGTYSATEGWLTVPLEIDQPGGIFHPGTHIVEFIEEGQDIEIGNLLDSWQLEVGKHYEVFLTTAMGFVRYRLKDIVKCTGYFHHAPRLEFCYKTQLLKLESCAISAQELQQMIQAVHFNMAPHWYFARNMLGDSIVLVVDDKADIAQSTLKELHEQLMHVSDAYAHGVETGEVLPMQLLHLPLEQLLEDVHAQTKPKLISQQVMVC